MRFYLKTVGVIAALSLLGGCGGGSGDSDGPAFATKPRLSVMEGTETIPVNATDKNGVTYTIAGGADAALFTIDPVSGELRFKTAPDFENSADADSDGRYEVVVEATDTKGNISKLPLTITVTDDVSDNGPAFTSKATVTRKENLPLDFTVTTEPVNGTAVSYAISGGADGKKVTIDPHSGKLSYAHFRPDFDLPSDADHHNDYEITVQATDDRNHSSVQHITVKIENDPDDLVPSRHVWKTGQDDGVIAGLPFGDDRDFTVQNPDGERVIVAGNRMWEDSPHTVGEANTVTFYGAQDYCNALSYGGYDDWRVPNRHELAEMLNYGKSDVLMDDIFANRSGANYWTSQQKLSSGGNGSDLGWSISFADGGVHDKNKGDAYNVRCVRGKEIIDHDDFTPLNGTEIIRDNKTGLMWQNAEFMGGKSWEEAKETCKNLVFHGYDDWRLPNVNEMRTIMPYDDNEILFKEYSPVAQGYLDSGHSWSSTQADADHAYYNLNDWDQATNRDSLIIMYEEYPKTDTGDMMLNRCVRGGHL
jgi:hypothetical protein